MQLIDRIEKRRFVGREFLLFLWFESELFEATLSTERHGPFGLWLANSLVLSEGRESTKITAPLPGAGREAKEALLRGQLPESAGIRIAWHDDETAFVLKAENLALAGLKLKTVLDKDDGPSELLRELTGQKGPARKQKAAEPQDDHEQFFERMALTQELEELLEALYRDFLSIRLSARWPELVLPALRRWVLAEAVDADAYQALRNPAPSPPKAQSALELSAQL
jgi:hypothetical protein